MPTAPRPEDELSPDPRSPDPQPPILIRCAAPDDLPALAALLQAVGWWPALNAAAPAELHARIGPLLRQALQDDSHTLLVAIDPAGALLGYTAVHWLPYLFLPGPEGYISELFVHPQARGCGVGARLLEAVAAEARRRGCSRLSLLNNRSRDSYARKFYEKHGWEERPVMANFIRKLE